MEVCSQLWVLKNIGVTRDVTRTQNIPFGLFSSSSISLMTVMFIGGLTEMSQFDKPTANLRKRSSPL